MPSVFHFFSLGTVAENKPRSGPQGGNSFEYMVNCTPIEKMPAYDGEITFNPKEETIEGTDAQGEAYSVKTTSDVTYPCRWLPDQGNRISPPDVRRGMTVEIWRLGDTDQYYWRYMGLEPHLMTQETVIIAISANPNPGGSAVDLNNCYYLEISTHQGLITFATSQANGEPFKYTGQLNTLAGEWILTDDIGTLIELASRQGRVRMENAQGSSVMIEQQRVELEGPELVQFKSGGSTLRVTPEGIFGDAPNYAFK